MDKKQFSGSTYIERAKYYEEEYAKHHQKRNQISDTVNQPLPHYEPIQWVPNQHSSTMAAGSGSVTFKREPNDTPLSASELDYFFWNKLVHLGWRKSSVTDVKDSYQLMLACPECDRAIVSQQSHTVTYRKAKNMSDVTYIAAELKKHKDKCKPFEYDENGDLIEATPEATPFENFTIGDTRFDNIDGTTKVFTGGGWLTVTPSEDNTSTTTSMQTGFYMTSEVQDMLAKHTITYLDNK